MTPADENAIRAACRRCTEEIKQAMRKNPKPNWDATVKPIIKKHHQQIAPLGTLPGQSDGCLPAPSGSHY